MAALPVGAGVSFRPEHAGSILGPGPAGGPLWFEIHAENYLGAGGPPRRQLAALAERFPVSVHGVGLSIGGEAPPDPAHLARIRGLLDTLPDAPFSEHLAWSGHEGHLFPDLLPLPCDDAALERITAHVGRVQDALGRPMLLENPTAYAPLPGNTWAETDFLAEIARRSGCLLLLDVNNVVISAANLGFDAEAYIRAFPLDRVGEIHLAGHAVEEGAAGRLLIDTHDRPVAAATWALYDLVLSLGGPRPTLVEWDRDIPDWPVLEAEARAVARALAAVAGPATGPDVAGVASPGPGSGKRGAP